jgi:hypothetical protein
MESMELFCQFRWCSHFVSICLELASVEDQEEGTTDLNKTDGIATGRNCNDPSHFEERNVFKKKSNMLRVVELSYYTNRQEKQFLFENASSTLRGLVRHT